MEDSLRNKLLELIANTNLTNTYGPGTKGQMKPGGRIKWSIPDNHQMVSVSELKKILK